MAKELPNLIWRVSLQNISRSRMSLGRSLTRTYPSTAFLIALHISWSSSIWENTMYVNNPLVFLKTFLEFHRWACFFKKRFGGTRVWWSCRDGYNSPFYQSEESKPSSDQDQFIYIISQRANLFFGNGRFESAALSVVAPTLKNPNVSVHQIHAPCMRMSHVRFTDCWR